MPILKIPTLMKSYVNNQVEVHLKGDTVAEVLIDLVTAYPQIKVHIIDKNGDLRRYVNLFINGVDIKDINGIKTILQPDDKIILLPSISGGSQ